MMKGDPVRCRGELLMIPRLMAAFVGGVLFYFLVSVCDGVHPNGFGFVGRKRFWENPEVCTRASKARCTLKTL